MNIYSKVKGLAGINSIEYFLTDVNNNKITQTYSTFNEDNDEINVFTNAAIDTVVKTKSFNVVNFETINFSALDDLQNIKIFNVDTDKTDGVITLTANKINLNADNILINQDNANFKNIKVNGHSIVTEQHFLQYKNPKLTKSSNSQYIIWEQPLDITFTNVPFIQIHEDIKNEDGSSSAVIKLAAIRFMRGTPVEPQKIRVRFDMAGLNNKLEPELQGPLSIEADKYVMQVFGTIN
jgi:hypothetical protein